MRHGFTFIMAFICLILVGSSLAVAQSVSDDFNAHSLKRSISTTGDHTASTLDGPTISVWYGQVQAFGHVGVPQRTADILGNASGPNGIDSLFYTLNGDPPSPLSLGPDGRLLQQPGDFKINLPYAALLSGANTLIIGAKDSTGVAVAETVTVMHDAGNVWPVPYAVTWSAPSSLNDSAQVVDGRWAYTGQAIRTSITGYDRAIAIGDTTWTDYEVAAELTVNRIDSIEAAFSQANGGPAVGFLLRWVGYTNQPTFNPPITQPLTGYLPLGALGWYHWRRGFGQSDVNRWEILGNNLALRDANSDSANILEYGTKYIVKMQVRTQLDSRGFYRLKFWKAGEVEPGSWLLSALESATDPQHGSLLIMGHYVDVSIGRVTVVPLQGDAIPPQIAQIQAVPGAHSAFVKWGTNEPATSEVAYGTTSSYTDTVSGEDILTNSHGVFLDGLLPNTLYHYHVISTDSAGNTSASNDSTFTTSSPPPPSTFLGDEFNTASLDSARWTFVNPTPPGGASYSKEDTTVTLVVPAGAPHEIWTNGYQVPRLVQTVNNSDFHIEVKFNSSLGPQFQSQGIVVEQDSANLIRMDFYGNGTQTRIFVATFTNGFSAPVIVMDAMVGETGLAPLVMRLQREDDGWTVSYSANGGAWEKLTKFFHAMVVRKIGLFAGNAGATPPAFSGIVDYIRGDTTAVGRRVVANLKVLLEGAYAGDTMKTTLAALLPKTQPYGIVPWSYSGTESVSTIPASVVDWVLLELRSDTASSPTDARRAGFLLKDGHIVDLDGSSPLAFPAVAAGNYYAVVVHRNHLAIMSAARVHFDTSAVLYDFTTAQGKAYGTKAMKALGSKFGLYVGDANADGQVTSLDFDQFNPKFRSALTGYQVVDWNMDGQVTSLDFDLFNANFRAAAASKVPQ